ncbi:hypothetical protein K525DRAFT_239142 [Schizophyllum commune Loenen D]|nr:hypothetical protein K525DRAFT_239142 [Schizophyllum commune Loenen D]
MSQNLGAGILYLLGCGCCCPGGQDPYNGTSTCCGCCGGDSNVHAREKEVDSEFLERDYRRDASGHIHIEPSPTRSMTAQTRASAMKWSVAWDAERTVC